MSVGEFKKNGYTLIRSLVSPELRDVITQYALFDEMQDFSADGHQVPNAHAKYADPAMEAMLLHLHPKIEKYTGIKLYPTYSFYRVYRNGDELKPHTDRPSCEISATVCFNYSYDTADYTWPIYMDKNPLVMMPGDGAIYRGMELEHYREPLVQGIESWHVQGFFHYVDISGPHSNFKFDQRSSIGALRDTRTKKGYITYV